MSDFFCVNPFALNAPRRREIDMEELEARSFDSVSTQVTSNVSPTTASLYSFTAQELQQRAPKGILEERESQSLVKEEEEEEEEHDKEVEDFVHDLEQPQAEGASGGAGRGSKDPKKNGGSLTPAPPLTLNGTSSTETQKEELEPPGPPPVDEWGFPLTQDSDSSPTTENAPSFLSQQLSSIDQQPTGDRKHLLFLNQQQQQPQDVPKKPGAADPPATGDGILLVQTKEQEDDTIDVSALDHQHDNSNNSTTPTAIDTASGDPSQTTRITVVTATNTASSTTTSTAARKDLYHPLPDEESPAPTGRPEQAKIPDEEELESNNGPGSNNNSCDFFTYSYRTALFFMGFLTLALLLAFLLGWLLGQSPAEEPTSAVANPTTMANNNNISHATPLPVPILPSSAPTTPPPSTPAISPFETFRDTLPDYTRQSLLDPQSSPQARAIHWLFVFRTDQHKLPLWRQTQLFVLATLYYALEGGTTGNMRGWLTLSENYTECNWYSKTVSEDHEREDVVLLPCNEQGEYQSLRLETISSSQQLPPELELLTNLREIEISKSSIQASLLEEWIPTQLYQMTQLEELSFPANNFTGPIPSQLGLLTNLKKLDLHSNSLTGLLPTELGELKQLQELKLQENGLQGPIPSQLALLTALQGLYLFNNSLIGMIPTEFGSFGSLTGLYLGQNRFLSSPIPSEIGLASSLQHLQLQENAFSGQIPSQLGLLSLLEEAAVNNNLLKGMLPSELSLMTRMTHLSLNSNSFDGTIPADLIHLTSSMIHFNVSDNDLLSGTMPYELCMYQGSFDCTHLLCGCSCICTRS